MTATNVRVRLLELVKKDTPDTSFEELREGYKRMGLFVEGVERSYKNMDDIIKGLKNEDLSGYYTPIEKAVLKVASVFFESERYVKQVLDGRVKREFSQRLYEKVAEGELLFRQQYDASTGKRESLERIIAETQTRVDEQRAATENYKLKLDELAEEIDTIEEDITGALNGRLFKDVAVYRAKSAAKQRERDGYAIEGRQIMGGYRNQQAKLNALVTAVNIVREIEWTAGMQWSTLRECKEQLESVAELNEMGVNEVGKQEERVYNVLVEHSTLFTTAAYAAFQQQSQRVRVCQDELQSKVGTPQQDVVSNATSLFYQLYRQTFPQQQASATGE